MPRVAKGCVEQLPSGSWRARVYAGIDPITKREIRLKATAKTEQQAHIELGRLLKEAPEGRTPESEATVAKLLDEYVAIAPWDVSTRQTNEGFIHRTIKPALGPMKVRKVRVPILDKLYAELNRCGHLSCTGRPFIEHRNVPVLAINPRDSRPAWQQVAETLADAIESGFIVPGDELPSITELSALQGIGTGVIRHALETLAADGLIIARHGGATVVAGAPSDDPRLSRRRPGPGHDCRRAGCKPHVSHPMKASTIRGTTNGARSICPCLASLPLDLALASGCACGCGSRGGVEGHRAARPAMARLVRTSKARASRRLVAWASRPMVSGLTMKAL